LLRISLVSELCLINEEPVALLIQSIKLLNLFSLGVRKNPFIREIIFVKPEIDVIDNVYA
jgi:hypothetical protein